MRFPERLTQRQVVRLVEFLSHQVDERSKRMTKAEVKAAISSYMPVNPTTGRIEDGDGYPFDPSQVDRRKRGIPQAFTTSAKRYMEEKFDELSMYHILKNVLEIDIDPDEFLFRAIAEREFGIRGQTLGSIRRMAESINLSKPIFEFEEQDGKKNAFYLIITMLNDVEVSVSPMTMTLGDDELAVPEFNTRSYNPEEVIGDVTGFMIEASTYLYTIGHDFGHSNLRISKLMVQPRFREGTDNPNRYDLVGLRVGGFSSKSRPNTHRVFAYQIASRSRMDTVTENIRMTGSARNYSKKGLTIPEGLSQDFEIAPMMAQAIFGFLTAPTETEGHLDTPPVEQSL